MKILLLIFMIFLFGCGHCIIGTKVRNIRADDRNFNGIGIIHSVYKDRWGNDSWVFVDYDGPNRGGLKGEYLHDLIKVEEK